MSGANITLLHNPRRQPRPFFYKTCGEAATATLGAKPRQPSPLNLLNLLNPHAAGVSNEPSHRRCVSQGNVV